MIIKKIIPQEKKEREFLIFIVSICLIIISWKYFGSINFFQNFFSQGLLPIEGWSYHFAATSFFFLLLPMALSKYIFKPVKENYALFHPRYSQQDWYLLGVLIILFIGASFVASHEPTFQTEYPFLKLQNPTLLQFGMYSLSYLLFYYLPWEYFYRQFIQTNLLKHIGVTYAIGFQVLASCLAHIGKPTGEIYGAIFAGIFWGYWAHKNKSILFPLISHWILGTSLDYFLIYH